MTPDPLADLVAQVSKEFTSLLREIQQAKVDLSARGSNVHVRDGAIYNIEFYAKRVEALLPALAAARPETSETPQPFTVAQVNEIRDAVINSDMYVLSGKRDQQLVDMLNHYATLLAAPAVPREGWQPMETAPKDGTRFLALFEDGEVGVLHWDTQYNPHVFAVKSGFYAPRWNYWMHMPAARDCS